MQGYKKRSVAPLSGALQEGAIKSGRYEISFKTNGTTREAWIRILSMKGFTVERSARAMLDSPEFKVTSGENITIVIFKPDVLKKIIGTPDFKKDYAPATAEMACYLRDKLKGPELKALRIETLVVGHGEPIIAFDGLPRMLVIRHSDRTKSLTSLSVRGGNPHSVDGYAYVKKPKMKKR